MSTESSRNALEDCPRCGNETTTDALTYQGCPDCQAEIAGYRAAEASSRNAAVQAVREKWAGGRIFGARHDYAPRPTTDDLIDDVLAALDPRGRANN